MKRIGNLFAQIVDMDNLRLADTRARKGKHGQKGVIVHRLNQEGNLLELQRMLLEKRFKTSDYVKFIIHEPKEREIFRLPYFPDRIMHHAIMNILEPVWMATFTADTYSCIKGRGIHKAAGNIRKALQDAQGTQYCLKLDIKKFYPSVDHGVMKGIVRKRIKDADLLELLDGIIDSADGLPIGNYLSQYLANLYLSYFDHWVKESLKVEYYFRYCDDLVILGSNKAELHRIRIEITKYLADNLKLQVKGNHQVFPVASRSIDFVGYRFYHTHTMLRKSIKQSFARAVSRKKPRASIAAYLGWAKHANTRHLVKKLTLQYEEVFTNGNNNRGHEFRWG